MRRAPKKPFTLSLHMECRIPKKGDWTTHLDGTEVSCYHPAAQAGIVAFCAYVVGGQNDTSWHEHRTLSAAAFNERYGRAYLCRVC
jgi:hypothetical protein